MRIKSIRMKSAALTMMLILALASSGYANVPSNSSSIQQPKSAPAKKAQIDDDLAKALEAALIELSHLRTVKRLSDEEKAALNDKIVALEDLVKIERERATAYKAANDERAKANVLDDRRIQTYEQIVTDYKAERERLIKERDGARRGNKVWAGLGFVFGAVLVLFAKGRN